MRRSDATAPGGTGNPGGGDPDRIVETALQRDRAGLTGGHRPERTKARAMAAVVAAGAAPVAEGSAAGYGWLTKLLSAKGILGTVGAVALAGGAGYGVLSVTGILPNDSSERNGAVERLQSAPTVLPPIPPEAVQELRPADPTANPAEKSGNADPGEFGGVSDGGISLSRSEEDSVSVVPPYDRAPNENAAPELQRIDSARMRIRLDPITINRK